jgi:hypothetical protein
MYKRGFESKWFLRTHDDILEEIDGGWTDYPDELRAYYKKVLLYSNVELINEIDDLQDEYYHLEVSEKLDDKTKSLLVEKSKIAKDILRTNLGLGFNLHYLIDHLQEQFELIADGFKKLEKYRDHRHRTMLGLYTEKPNY